MKLTLPFDLKDRRVLWGLRYAALFSVFLASYLPFHLQLRKAASACEAKSKQVESVKKAGSQFLGPNEMTDLKKRADNFEKGFADSSQAALLLSLISDHAIQNHLKVAKINSDIPLPVQDVQSKEVQIGGKKLSRIPINLYFDADLRTLANFLHSFSESSEYSLVVESFSLRKDDPSLERIQCEMTLDFFSAD